jgi:hypothetical protein
LLKIGVKNRFAAGKIIQIRQSLRQLLQDDPIDKSIGQLLIERLDTDMEKLIDLEGM